jgi:hypothetical protein
MRGVLASVQRAIERPGVLNAVPILFFALLLVGAVRAYTAVPTYDMWEGALLTSFRVLDGDPWEILRFWNEHRIVLSKILFWLETRFFGARFFFLIAVNIVLLVGLWLALCAAVKPLIADSGLQRIVCAGVAALCFSWLQHENIESPFQSQFLLAYLVPLLAFLTLANAAHWRWFAAALFLGAASLGTMANGLLVFPLLILMQVLLGVTAGRAPWLRLVVLVVIGAALTALWFQGFPGTQSRPPAVADMLIFAATFLAFPVADIAGIAGGIIGSLVFLGALLFVLRQAWRGRDGLDPNFIALLMFLAYIGASSVMTAYGRAADLTNAALVSRYATPSLLAWATLAILLAAVLQTRPNARGHFASAALVLALIFLPAQVVRTIGGQGPEFVHGSQRGALALELAVRDLTALAGLFPAPAREHYDLLKTIADDLAARRLSTFADPRWDNVIAKMGTRADSGFHACKSNIEAVTDIPGVSRYKAVQGWVIDEGARRQPDFIHLAAGGEIVGLAVVGGPRPDVAVTVGWKVRNSGFAGYVLASDAAAFTLVCPDPSD